ncbi:WD40 repeat domain-containing serine/threonine protein kinase [Tautonia plasticadhaerens]|uniref:Serine/threonine-protein kinase PrkC n=1 Tax=Tautonia plasticadhaerens TaxID=2527974 RepID=A0A518GV71_9BACT|nr:protein kinase [Tautonia plasticadhaerens]QDV32476.1 Serine/threonine-protein kinase PrkC [Tautonia plasticadhaerens]
MTPHDPSTQVDDRALAGRVAELAGRIEAGEPVDLDALRRDEPEVADRVLGLLPVLGLLARLGLPSGPGGPTPIGALPPDEFGEGIGRLGEFVLLRQIARGGMGVVFEARQLGIGRRVALKILPAVSALDPLQRRRFQVEARAAGALNHDHIVPVYFVGSEEGVHYYAMQLVDGRSLAQVLADLRRGGDAGEEPAPTRADGDIDLALEGALDLELDLDGLGPPDIGPDPTSLGPSHAAFVARLGLQAAEALAHAHEQGVIHRDVKPGNLLLDHDGRLWIADFGLARLQGDAGLTASGVLVGTFRYMSPEQAASTRGVPVDHRTDIYSLGATLYELLTLRPAFDDADRRVVLRRIIEDRPTPIRQLNPTVPADLETVVAKAMAKDPDDRYATAAELADDLSRFLDGRNVLARRPSPLDRAARWAYRRRLAVASALLMLGLVTAALGVAVVLIARAQARTADALADAKASRDAAIAERNRADDAAGHARSSERFARELLYVSNLKLAAEALLDRDPLLMKEYLDRHVPEAGEPDLRDFAWWFLKTQGEMPFDELAGPGPPLYFIAFSPDGRLMATCGQDAVIRLSERPGDRLVSEIETGQGEVNGLAFSPDGRRLASAGDDGTVRLWDLETSREIWRAQAIEDGLAFQVAFARGGEVLASCGQESVIRLWDAETGAPVGELRGPEADGPTLAVEAIAVTPDGLHLAAAGPGDVARVWDLESRSVALERGGAGRPTWVAFSPDGDRVAVGRKKGVLEVVDRRSGATVLVEKLRDDVQALAMLRGGSVLAASDRGGMIHLFPLPAPDGPGPGAIRPPWLAHGDRLYALAADPDGDALVSAGADGRARRWHPLEPDRSRRWAIDRGECGGFAFSPGGRSLWVLRGSGVVPIGLAPDGEARPVELGDASFLGLHADRGCRRIAACGRRAGGDGPPLVVVWDRTTGSFPFRWEPRGGIVSIRSVAISPDGRRLAAYGSRDRAVPVGRRVSLSLFDLEAGGPPLDLGLPGADSAGTMSMVDFAPDGRLLAASSGHDILLVDPVAGRPLRPLSGHSGTVGALAFSPDGALLASAGDDRRLVLWELASNRPVFSTLALDSQALALAFSPDGRLLASVGRDGLVLLWHVPTRQLLMEIPATNPHGGNPGEAYDAIAFGPDGRRLAVRVPEDVLILDSSTASSAP